MKIKADFVTNSSSTCFVLQYDCYLKPIFHNEIDCKETLVKVIDSDIEGVNSTELDVYSNDYSACMSAKIFDINEDKENTGEIEVDILNIEDYDEKIDDVRNSLSLYLKATSPLINNDPKDVYHTIFVNILNKVFGEINEDLEFIFHQFPSVMTGDGWDGGDPMGQYSRRYDLFKDLTKTGKLIRKDGQWTLKLKNSEDL
jgi:hypothetical protein